MHELIVPVIHRVAYTVGYERAADATFVHVVVRVWSAAVARQFKSDIAAAHALLGEPVYAIGRPEAPLQPKFLHLFGFVPCGTVRDAGGRVVPIYGRPFDGIALRRWHHHPDPE